VDDRKVGVMGLQSERENRSAIPDVGEILPDGAVIEVLRKPASPEGLASTVDGGQQGRDPTPSRRSPERKTE
jgi:hypothetical protein